jgi:hypothetical protein
MRKTIFYLASILSLSLGSNQAALAQATAIGSVTMSGPGGYIQSVSGQVSLPAGFFSGPLVITPNVTPTNLAPIDSLIINPGGIDFTLPPTTFDAQMAQLLDSYSDLSDRVSLIRANKGLLESSTSSQATALGSVSLFYPDGSSISASGETTLPQGLYFEGALTAGCGSGSGCLLITSVFNNPASDPVFDTLVIDPGVANIVNPSYSFSTVAAQQLTAYDPFSELSEVVSMIRAGTGPNGPYSRNTQARAMGSVSLSTPNGSTQSVSGEVTLPLGFYYGNGSGCGAGASCLTVQPNLTWDSTQPNLNTINSLTIDPGQVLGGTIGLSGSSFDFNAAATQVLYSYADSWDTANVVSAIRAGTGSNGLSSPNRPQARATGSSTVSLPNGTTQTVGGEISLPPGLYYLGTLVIDPDIDMTTAAGDPNSVLINSLTVDPGVPQDPSVDRPWDFEAAAAYSLGVAPDLASEVSVIRAVAGSNGLD